MSSDPTYAGRTLAEIEERARAATPGAWQEFAESGEWWIAGVDVEGGPLDTVIPDTSTDSGITQANIDHITTANPAVVLALTARINELERENEQLRTRNERSSQLLRATSDGPDEAREEVVRLRAALEQYADRRRWAYIGKSSIRTRWLPRSTAQDGDELARRALAGEASDVE